MANDHGEESIIVTLEVAITSQDSFYRSLKYRVFPLRRPSLKVTFFPALAFFTASNRRFASLGVFIWQATTLPFVALRCSMIFLVSGCIPICAPFGMILSTLNWSP